MSLSRNNALVKPGRKFAYQQIGFSILVVFICAFITYLFWGLSYTYSVLSGGAIGIIPNFILAYKAFKYAGATSSKLVLSPFLAA